jgi:maleylpyruvate isomerase
MADPLALAGDIQSATDRMLATARGVAEVSAPSLLPGWTRGHVLTHIARNADGAVNLLTWARTGVVTPQYVSWDARVADIEAGAGRPAQAQVTDLVEACGRFAEAVGAMPAEAWSRPVHTVKGPDVPAAQVMWFRLREVEIHHVDLGLAYGPADWPAAFTLRMARTLATDPGDGPHAVVRSPEIGHDLPIRPATQATVVSGPAWAAVAWLIGRSAGAGLSVEPPGSLPVIPAWG